MKQKLAYIGAGAGLVLFAIFGLLPGSFFGGVMGLNLSGLLFGYPVASSVISRLIVAVSMFIGVMVSGLIFLIAGATLGWLSGFVVDLIRKPVKKSAADEEHINSDVKNQ